MLLLGCLLAIPETLYHLYLFPLSAVICRVLRDLFFSNLTCSITQTINVLTIASALNT